MLQSHTYLFIGIAFLFVLSLFIKGDKWEVRWGILGAFIGVVVYYWNLGYLIDGEFIIYLEFLICVSVISLLKRYNIPVMVIPVLIFAIGWEILTEQCWTYKCPMPIWRDLPLSILFGWLFVMVLSQVVSEEFYRGVKGEPQINPFDPLLLLCDAGSMCIIGSIHETLCYKAWNMWDYHAIVFPISPLGIPYEVIIGYPGIAILCFTTLRVWQRVIDQKKATVKING
ncbi:MAG: hypothetical protein AB1422_00575 [bacterium]